MSNILKYQNPSSPLLKPWKALEKMNYETIPDSTYAREKTGMGSIEYFSADNNNGITYLNGYHKAHPKPGTDVILYDPATNDQQDVRLDALHFMPKDPVYGALYDEYLLAARDGDVTYNVDKLLQKYIDSNKLPEAFKTYDVKDIGGLRERLFLNEADGLLRNMFIEGTPEYIESKRYYPDKIQLEKWNAHLMPYINNIKTYLETGVKPEHVIEPAIVTAYKKGGRIHIKKKNRGKFTESAKRAGMGVQEFAQHVLANKDKYSSTLVKRANFARNSKKFKHESGGVIKAQNSAKLISYFPQHDPITNPEWKNLVESVKKRVAHKYSNYSEEELRKHLAKVKSGQEREFINPDGTVKFVINDNPIQPMEQSIVEWLPGTGDVTEVGQITNDVKNGNYGSAALGAAMMLLPGNVGKLLHKENPIQKLTNLTDSEWDDLYFKAIKENDVDGLKKLRTAHFNSKAVGNQIIANNDPIELYHFSESKFNNVDPTKFGSNDPGFYGRGFYTTPDVNYGSTYGPIKHSFYGYSKKPFKTNGDVTRSGVSFNFGRPEETPFIDDLQLLKEVGNSDAVWQQGASFFRNDKPIEELVFPSGNALKATDIITYDDFGNIIPISRRDNFDLNDFRYKQGGKIKKPAY